MTCIFLLSTFVSDPTIWVITEVIHLTSAGTHTSFQKCPFNRGFLGRKISLTVNLVMTEIMYLKWLQYLLKIKMDDAWYLLTKILSRHLQKNEKQKILCSTTGPRGCCVHPHFSPLFFHFSLSKFKDFGASIALVRVMHATMVYKVSYSIFCFPFLTSNILAIPKHE